MTESRYLQELGLNLQKLLKRLMANQELLRYLYYTDHEPLDSNKNDVLPEQVFGSHILATPNVSNEEIEHSIICLRVSKGTPEKDNIEFKKIQCHIEVFTPMTQWILKSDNLRPFLIMSEIEKSLQGKKVNGLGIIGPMPFELAFVTPNTSCYELSFTFTEYA